MRSFSAASAMVVAWLSQPATPTKAKPRAIGDLLREGHHRRARFDARAIHADVDLDRDAQPLARMSECRVELDQVLDAVDANDRIGVIGKAGPAGRS